MGKIVRLIKFSLEPFYYCRSITPLVVTQMVFSLLLISSKNVLVTLPVSPLDGLIKRRFVLC